MGLCQQGLGSRLPIHRYFCATRSPADLVPSCRVPEEATHLLPPWFLVFSSWFSTSSEIESKKGRLAVPPKCSCIPLSHPRPALAHPSPVMLLNPRHRHPTAPPHLSSMQNFAQSCPPSKTRRRVPNMRCGALARFSRSNQRKDRS